MNDNTQFMTIRQFAKQNILPEFAIRTLVKKGEIPGIFVGNRFYINAPKFKSQLNSFGGSSGNVEIDNRTA